MERFIARENVRHFEHLLEEAHSDDERARIEKMLAEARVRLATLEAKARAARSPGDPPPP